MTGRKSLPIHTFYQDSGHLTEAGRGKTRRRVERLGQDVQTSLHKTPNRFKVGDSVRVIGEAHEYQGRAGIVSNTYQLAAAESQRDSYRYVVLFIEDGADAVFYGFELEMTS